MTKVTDYPNNYTGTLVCQMTGCEEIAIYWTLYDGEPGYAVCPAHSEQIESTCKDPDLLEIRPLTDDVALLLRKING